MEAVVAVALAGNVLQFVETAYKLYKMTNDLRHNANGVTTEHSNIDSTAKMISKLTSELSETQTCKKTLTSVETKIKWLAEECNRNAQEIQAKIESMKLTGSRGFWRSIGLAFLNLRADRPIQEKLKRLDALQQQLGSCLLVYVSDQASEIQDSLDSLVKQHRALAEAIEGSMKNTLDKIQLDIQDCKKRLASDDQRTGGERQAALATSAAALKDHAENIGAFEEALLVLQSLKFESMMRRKDAIPDAHDGTLEWIFNEIPDFTNWLKADVNRPFWISGSPGSGKSTLMRHLSNSPSTISLLQEWAGDLELVTASFYFWAAGTIMQKSLDGLYQSLLYEIFSQDLSLVREVVPVSHRALGSAATWKRSDLLQTIRNLSRGKFFRAKFCIFLDGLDEYLDSAPTQDGLDGSDVAQSVGEIIEVVEALVRIPNFKICVSSRLWNGFKHAFGQDTSRMLEVQNLNYNDIVTFVRDEFETKNQDHLDTYSLRKLGNTIVHRSDGVFLWVFLIARSLTRGLRDNKDDFKSLEKRLNNLPSSLHGFFQRMLDSVEEVYQEEAARSYKLMLCNAGWNPLEMFSRIDVHSPTFGFDAKIRPIAFQDLEIMWKIENTRMHARCQDFLTTYPPNEDDFYPNVQWVHRSAVEFMRHQATQNILASKMHSEFNTIQYRLQVCIYLAKIYPDWRPNSDRYEFLTWISYAALHLTKLYPTDVSFPEDLPLLKYLEELHSIVVMRTGEPPDVWTEFWSTVVEFDSVAFLEKHVPHSTNLRIQILLSACHEQAMQVATLLLQLGTDPNAFDIDGRSANSPWLSFLLPLQYQKKKIRENLISPDEKEKRIAMMLLLLDHGADLDGDVGQILHPRRSMRLDEYLVSCLSQSERDRIEPIIAEKRAALAAINSSQPLTKSLSGEDNYSSHMADSRPANNTSKSQH